MFKRILVPLDESFLASKAIEYAVQVAKRFESEIKYLEVLEPVKPQHAVPGSMPGSTRPPVREITMEIAEKQQDANLNKAREYLSDRVKETKIEGVEAIFDVVIGQPAESIVEFAGKEDIDLVIMTTHGRTGLKKVIMGSVADSVIKHSKKPVLVVKAMEEG